MAQSSKDRVYAAAEQISADRRPTISTVRDAAGVSNADATRYLKEWFEEKFAAGGQVAATPAALLEQSSRLAGAVWLEASRLADEKHSAVESSWAQDRKNLSLEMTELVADLDKVTAEKDKIAEDSAVKLKDLEARLAGIEEQLREAKSAEKDAVREASATATKLAASVARAATLQDAHDALLQRIMPEAKA
jgi:hypothetical protein